MEKAILRTVLYADMFDYPLTPEEMTHYLIGEAGDIDQIRAVLAASRFIDGQISRMAGYVTLRGREVLVERRHERVRSSQKLWRMARFYVRIMCRLPFVRMVAVTGALAMDNSDLGDDVDVMMVTARGRVWLARALAVALVRLGKLTRATLCPNYIISQDILVLEPRNIYVAHEFVQMIPLFGVDVYIRLREANPWTRDFLPNAGAVLKPQAPFRLGWVSRRVKQASEWALSGKLGDRLESWEMKRKIRKLSYGKPVAADVLLSRDQVKGHFADHGSRISARYQSRLEDYRLDEIQER